MLYQIMDTKTSADDKICYSMYKHAITMDNLSVFTYGIIAVDSNESYSVDDITTDEDSIHSLMDNLCLYSIHPKEFLPFIRQFVDA